VRERCEVCGAGFQEDDRACRDCGAARPVSVVEPLPVAASVAAPFAAPQPIGVENSLAIPRRSRGAWLAGAVVLAVGLGAGGWWMVGGTPGEGDGATDRAADCDALAKLVGTWTFATEVTAAGTLGSSGLSGNYTLEVTAEGCTGSARLSKTGYTARKFSEAQIQRGEAELHAASAPGELGHGATFRLRDASGKGPDIEIGFAVDGSDRLVGVWRQRGKRWDRTRLSGFLDGRRASPGAAADADASADPVLLDQPCSVRCAVVCDAAGRDVAPAALETCTTACASTPGELPTCGDTKPLPAEHRLLLDGPHPSLAAACEAALPGGFCDKAPRVGKQRAPSLGRQRFDGGFQEARFVLLGDTEATARPRLALETAAGWHLSAPIDGLEPGATPLSVSDLRIHARHLSEGQGRRYVMGEVVAARGEAGSETLFVCRPADPPHCVLVPTRQSEGEAHAMRREVAPIPGGTLAIAADDDAPPGGLAPGVYSW
jgi:hypothetical protein